MLVDAAATDDDANDATNAANDAANTGAGSKKYDRATATVAVSDAFLCFSQILAKLKNKQTGQQDSRDVLLDGQR